MSKHRLSGVVTTLFQIEQLLINRPVQRGELLLEIMDPNGPLAVGTGCRRKSVWDISCVPPRERVTSGLPVEFILATSNETILRR